MTDRVHSLTVVLAKDTRVDDIEALQNAIRQFKGVIAVEGNIANHDSFMAEQRAQDALREKIAAILWPRS
jgi:hypothetical protein